jgi:hypothetical protein
MPFPMDLVNNATGAVTDLAKDGAEAAARAAEAALRAAEAAGEVVTDVVTGIVTTTTGEEVPPPPTAEDLHTWATATLNPRHHRVDELPSTEVRPDCSRVHSTTTARCPFVTRQTNRRAMTLMRKVMASSTSATSRSAARCVSPSAS